MIDDAFLSGLESYTGNLGNAHAAEIIRNARRYLALRKHGILLRQEAVVFDVTDIDAAADRLLEGGNENY